MQQNYQTIICIFLQLSDVTKHNIINSEDKSECRWVERILINENNWITKQLNLSAILFTISSVYVTRFLSGRMYANKTNGWIFVTKSRKLRWRAEEAYFKSEALSALPKLRRVLSDAGFEKYFLKGAGHISVFCFRLAPIVR